MYDNKELERYITDHIDRESDVLKELNRYTNINILRPRMLSGHIQGQLLKMICRMVNPVNILEIGTFTGYSAISMAEGINEHSHIDTIEVNDELRLTIEKFIKKAGYQDKITLHIGNALEIIPSLNKKFDLIFIDADKRQYPEYYKMVFPLLNNGGYILADNILWGGKVVQPLINTDEYTKGILEFNDMVKNDKRVEKVILPFRDGLFLIRKKE
ncbi:MAG: methyltransferase [Chlorobi bacterium]|nr:methyltransferase [Chlorobiota bacterium]